MYKEDAKTALKDFMEFLEGQDKIVVATDLIPSLIYTRVSGIPGRAYRCNLWTGLRMSQRALLGDKGNYDAQINLEIDPAEVKEIYSFIIHHEPGKKLSDIDSWRFADER